MFQSQSYKLDESQVIECQRTHEQLEYELEMLTAYQNKNKKQAQEQRDRERRELENRVSVRRGLLENKVSVPSLSRESGAPKLTTRTSSQPTDGRRVAAIQPGTRRALAHETREAY